MMISVKVIYALPADSSVIECQINNNATIKEILVQAGIIEKYKLNIDECIVGIWGKRCELTDTANNGDRIEIYRPLLDDPKEIRRRREKEYKKHAKM